MHMNKGSYIHTYIRCWTGAFKGEEEEIKIFEETLARQCLNLIETINSQI